MLTNSDFYSMVKTHYTVFITNDGSWLLCNQLGTVTVLQSDHLYLKSCIRVTLKTSQFL